MTLSANARKTRSRILKAFDHVKLSGLQVAFDRDPAHFSRMKLDGAEIDQIAWALDQAGYKVVSVNAAHYDKDTVAAFQKLAQISVFTPLESLDDEE